jgi:hypothetical protein
MVTSMTLKRFHSSSMIAAVLLAVLIPSGAALTQSSAQTTAGAVPPSRAPEPAADAGAFRHLRVLQDIASANGGNRAAGTLGYDHSAEYVSGQLAKAGYRVRFEEFEFPFFEERSPPVLAVNAAVGPQGPAPSEAIRTLANSGAGDVTARLRAVNLALSTEPPAASASGCEAEGTDGRRDAFSGQLSKLVPVPVVGVPYRFGRVLDLEARAGDVTVHLAVDAIAGKRPSHNVIAESAGGGDDALIMAGAHLDSVPEGPGINDNGSGTAAVLEAALQLAPELAQGRRHVRFAFWGAEERGLIGSRHHVDALSEEERRHIALYINLDMVGSPNFTRYIQGPATTDDGPAALARRELAAEFREHGLNIEERTGTRFGSDDSSFSQKGIPTVGLYTGASGMKSEKQSSLFGGTAGRPFDPCYHQACDTIDNIDRGVLEQNARALVRTLKAVAIAAGGPGRPDAP